MTLHQPKEKAISKIIPPNYSTWETIELSYQCAKYAIDRNIEGHFVECGVAAGNNLAAMCLAGRHGYGFDSFQGIPWAGENDKEQPGIGDIDKSKIGFLESSGITAHTEENVRADMAKYGIKNYTLIKGWFQNTLPGLGWMPQNRISVLRLDGDLYDSTFVCLKYLYNSLSKGGILIIDDWNLEGCRKAFEDYFSDKEKPTMIFDNGVTYWMK